MVSLEKAHRLLKEEYNLMLSNLRVDELTFLKSFTYYHKHTHHVFNMNKEGEDKADTLFYARIHQYGAQYLAECGTLISAGNI